jgi:hypothetical protein
MIKLKSILLNEDIPIDVRSVFGNIVFGDDTTTGYADKIVDLQGKRGYEPNTPEEAEILELLEYWVNEPDADIAEKIYQKRDILKKAAKVFPSIFKPKFPNGTRLYRGLPYIPKNILDALKKTTFSDYEDHDVFGGYYYKQYKVPIQYSPMRKIQSWTTDVLVPNLFTWSNEKSDPSKRSYSGAILTTWQNDEFLFNPDFLEILLGDDEREVIHIGQEYEEDVHIIIHVKLFHELINTL